MPTLLEVWQSRLGIKEIVGPEHNAIILQWWEDAGHPEIIDDETAWCSGSMASAAKEAGLPFPPPNVNAAARSWLTMGVRVAPGDAQPGDVVVWPRGKSSWQGHVNCVHDVKRVGGKVMVRCIGGNQSNAVTVTAWTDLAGALPNGIRRLVPPTVKALRPHSSEIKTADKVEVSSWLALLASSMAAAVKELLAPVAVPEFTDLPAALDWWGVVLTGINAVGRLFLGSPWLAGGFLICLICILVARVWRKKRIEKHSSGIPISSQIAGVTT